MSFSSKEAETSKFAPPRQGRTITLSGFDERQFQEIIGSVG